MTYTNGLFSLMIIRRQYLCDWNPLAFLLPVLASSAASGGAIAEEVEDSQNSHFFFTVVGDRNVGCYSSLACIWAPTCCTKHHHSDLVGERSEVLCVRKQRLFLAQMATGAIELGDSHCLE